MDTEPEKVDMTPEERKELKLKAASQLANVLLWLGATAIGIALLMAFLK
jgi:hypothetical protein